MCVVVEAAAQFFPGIVKTLLEDADFCRLEVSCISPGLVPRHFPEEVIRLLAQVFPVFIVHRTQIFQADSQIIQGFTVIGLWITLHDQSYCFAEVALCLAGASLADVP